MAWLWGTSNKEDDAGSYDSEDDAEYTTDDEDEEDDENEAATEAARLLVEAEPASDTKESEVTPKVNPNDDEDEVADTQVLMGVVPSEVSSDDGIRNRDRLDSGLTFGDEDINEPSDDDESSDEQKRKQVTGAKKPAEKEKEEEQVTSLLEKQSLLTLAAEHDRVDILQAIFAGTEEEKVGVEGSTGKNQKTADDSDSGHQQLLQGKLSIPPLHIAVSYGSVNATNCLLRMGADPSIRPNLAAIQMAVKEAAAELKQDAPPPVAHMSRYSGATAWELVFGTPGSKWSLFGNSSSSESSVRPNIRPFDMQPSKKEGIRHAFTAEALRCIGADEVDRLKQLLTAGMPDDSDIGGKSLFEWSMDMEAPCCQELLSKTDSTVHTKANEPSPAKSQVSGGVRRSQKPESIAHLRNRLDEVESLAKALSSCLDSLGEEVAVCSGLLLMGSGAAALASHVKSLRAQQDEKEEELERMQLAWENSHDELAYWVKQCGPDGIKIAENQLVQAKDSRSKTGNEDPHEAEKQEAQQLMAQIAASESKVRLLRVSISDLSEESARNLKEVEKRGLSGGINLVRTLQEEIRAVEFQLSELKSNEAECRIRICLVQERIREHQNTKETVVVASTNNPTDNSSSFATHQSEVATAVVNNQAPSATVENSATQRSVSFAPDVMMDSDKITAGHSTAIALRNGQRGFFPLSLWQILLRIIGMGENGLPSSTKRGGAQPAIII